MQFFYLSPCCSLGCSLSRMGYQRSLCKSPSLINHILRPASLIKARVQEADPVFSRKHSWLDVVDELQILRGKRREGVRSEPTLLLGLKVIVHIPDDHHIPIRQASNFLIPVTKRRGIGREASGVYHHRVWLAAHRIYRFDALGVQIAVDGEPGRPCPGGPSRRPRRSCARGRRGRGARPSA